MFDVLLLVGTTVFRKDLNVISNRIGVKFGGIVLQIYTHRLTESDFGCDITLSRWRLCMTFARRSLLQRPPAAHLPAERV